MLKSEHSRSRGVYVVLCCCWTMVESFKNKNLLIWCGSSVFINDYNTTLGLYWIMCWPILSHMPFFRCRASVWGFWILQYGYFLLSINIFLDEVFIQSDFVDPGFFKLKYYRYLKLYICKPCQCHEGVE